MDSVIVGFVVGSVFGWVLGRRLLVQKISRLWKGGGIVAGRVVEMLDDDRRRA